MKTGTPEKTTKVSINPGLHRKVKTIAAIRGMKIGDVVEKALTEWVQKNDGAVKAGVDWDKEGWNQADA